jgi:hypothetical protein
MGVGMLLKAVAFNPNFVRWIDWEPKKMHGNTVDVAKFYLWIQVQM